MTDRAPHSSWITNSILGALVVVTLGSAGVMRDSYLRLTETVQSQNNTITRIEAKLEAMDDWRSSHEARPHQSDELRDNELEARIVALELAVALLKRQRAER